MISEITRQRLVANWQRVQAEVTQACHDAGRDPQSVTVIGVAKYVDAEVTRALFDLGCRHLGESRPQGLWQKARVFGPGDPVRWHLIGHLQRNKIRRTLQLGAVIHSMDSRRLLTAISEQAAALDLTATGLLEINISGDAAKTGMSLPELDAVIAELPLPHLEVRGLMGMAGWGSDPLAAGRQFERLARLRDEVQQRLGAALPELSMGMSNDFVEAIRAGATMVRIGSRLFDGILP